MKTAAVTLFFAVLAAAQTPRVTHAQWQTRAAGSDAAASLRNLVKAEAGPLWFGYAVEAQEKQESSCCWDDQAAGCRLEPGTAREGQAGKGQPVQLEGSRILIVLYRVQNHSIEKIQPVSGNCPLDAGGLRFIWFTGVATPASIAFLEQAIVRSVQGRDDGKNDGRENGRSLSDGALVSIALHGGGAADAALERFAAAPEPEWLREKALFWLASARGACGLAVVRNTSQHDPSSSLREKTMFDLTLSKEPAAIDALLDAAKHDREARVRSQALFWLAQKAGQRAAQALGDAIDRDPDTEVKIKAVFGLQQLPPDEGVPLLIQVAKTNHNPEVRKQAMFWLGQSGDARALAFIQEILLGKS